MIKCIDVLEGLEKLEDNSVDICICDPPYGTTGHDFGNNIDKYELNEYVMWCLRWFNECYRILKPTGTGFIYGYLETLAHISIKMDCPLKYLLWTYKNKAIPSLKFWQRSHEAIICFWKYKESRIFNLEESRIPYSDVYIKNAMGKPRKTTKGRFSDGKTETFYSSASGALPRDVIEVDEGIPDVIPVAALAGGAGLKERLFLCKTCDQVYSNKELKNHNGHEIVKHETQKPLELTRRLIVSCKPKEGGTVLIPFVGGGTECIVTKSLGMDYIGFDINPDYILLAKKTLDYYFTPNTPLNALESSNESDYLF